MAQANNQALTTKKSGLHSAVFWDRQGCHQFCFYLVFFGFLSSWPSKIKKKFSVGFDEFKVDNDVLLNTSFISKFTFVSFQANYLFTHWENSLSGSHGAAAQIEQDNITATNNQVKSNRIHSTTEDMQMGKVFFPLFHKFKWQKSLHLCFVHSYIIKNGKKVVRCIVR